MELVSLSERLIQFLEFGNSYIVLVCPDHGLLWT